MIRRVLLGSAIAALGTALMPASGPAQQRSLDLVGAGLRQHADLLIMAARTSDDWEPADLGSESLCLELHRSVTIRRVCLVGPRRLRLRYDRLRPYGGVERSRLLAHVRVRRADRRSAVASFQLASLGMRPGRVQWRAFSSPGSGCRTPQAPGACQVSVPATGLARLRIRRPRIVGCTRQGPALRRRGSSRHREVALTFDDGPSPYTEAVLRTLHRFHAPATFFLIGAQVRRHPTLARRELLAGDEIGNHSLRHARLPSRSDLRATNGIIHRATRFLPCDFRPPYGAVDSRLVDSALSLGMTSVLWDVDPRDWSLPGAGAIARNVLSGARPGGILLMHDGGGPRSQTVAALPAILRGLERRHYHLVTVSQLLGGRERWYPR